MFSPYHRNHHLRDYDKVRRETPLHEINVNEVHQQSQSTNERIAVIVANHVGTMVFCYCLATLMLWWTIVMEAILPALHVRAPDPFPFSFLFFILGGIMQSLLMPLIMVAQNIEARRSELLAEHNFHTNQAIYHTLQKVVGKSTDDDPPPEGIVDGPSPSPVE